MIPLRLLIDSITVGKILVKKDNEAGLIAGKISFTHVKILLIYSVSFFAE